jgi:hypothetical protein
MFVLSTSLYICKEYYNIVVKSVGVGVGIFRWGL